VHSHALEEDKNSRRPLRDLAGHANAAVPEDVTLREAVRRMARERVDRLAVLSCEKPHKLIGVLTQADLLAAFRHEEEGLDGGRSRKLPFLGRGHAGERKG